MMESKLDELQHHKNETIAWHAQRALIVLQPYAGEEYHRARGNADVIEVVKP